MLLGGYKRKRPDSFSKAATISASFQQGGDDDATAEAGFGCWVPRRRASTSSTARSMPQQPKRKGPLAIVHYFNKRERHEAHRAASSTRRKAKPVQTFLDFGQKSFGRRTLCSECGLLYVNGEEEDEQQHTSFCRMTTDGVSLALTEHDRVVQRLRDGDAVVEVRPTDPPQQLARLKDVKRIMDMDMGFPTAGADGGPLGAAEKAFLYVKLGRVVGGVIAEQVEHAFLLLDSAHNDVQVATGSDPSPQSFDVTAPLPASVGIRQVWVSKRFRRQGVATALLEVVRTRFYYGIVIPKEKVAFSQLSSMGHRLARAFTQHQRPTTANDDAGEESRGVLVY